MEADPFSYLLVLESISSVENLTIVLEMVVFVILLLLSGFFSGAEVALLSLTLSQKAELLTMDDRASKRVLKLTQQIGETIVTILTMNTLINVSIAILGALITLQVATFFALSEWIIFFIEVIALTFILLILGEITPKMIAQKNAVVFSRLASAPLLMIGFLFRPLSKKLVGMSQSLRAYVTPPAKSISPDDIRALADVGMEQGTLEEVEHEMIHSIVDFSETSVREVMVSRMDIVAINSNMSLSEGIELIRESGFSRFPVFDEDLDNIKGLVYAKDLIPFLIMPEQYQDFSWLSFCRMEPLYVPETKKINDLLEQFRAKKMHLAIVTDEHGGTEGLVTLENILEEIVGDIRDEHDEEEEVLYEQINPNIFSVSGKMNLEEFGFEIDRELLPEDDTYDTIAGLILHLKGDFPDEGTQFEYNNLKLTVKSVENHRIETVEVEILPA